MKDEKIKELMKWVKKEYNYYKNKKEIPER